MKIKFNTALLILFFFSLSASSIAADNDERPMSLTLNIASLTSSTIEGRFNIGLVPQLSLVISPNLQKTMDLPLYHPKNKQWSSISFTRFNIGAGLRGHFYRYDSYDGWFIEGMARGGMTWVGDDSFMWSFIPSFMIGYQVVYDSGYTFSIGLGGEYEILSKATGYHSDFIKTAYLGITKLPIMGEVSIGWSW